MYRNYGAGQDCTLKRFAIDAVPFASPGVLKGSIHNLPNGMLADITMALRYHCRGIAGGQKAGIFVGSKYHMKVAAVKSVEKVEAEDNEDNEM